MGGSPGGARPKITVFIEGNKIENGFYKGDLFSAIDHNSNQSHENWIIKFRSSTDTEKDSLSEYVYSLVAKKVGIVIEPTALFDDKKNGIWFGMKRFDRGDAGEKIHMHTLAGLLHADHRSPSMDYESVLKATFALTRSIEEVENIFRIAVFNGEFHNRDDHTKNFSFLMTSDRKWKVSPAYDLTYSTGMGGEHATSFAGEGKNPQKVDYLKVAISGGIQKKHALEIIDEVCAGKEFLRDKCKEFGLKELWKVFDAK